MMPGMGRMNQRQMKRMLKKQGINIDELENVIKVVIHLEDKTLVFDAPSVTMMKMQGQETYQVIGTPVEKGPSAGGDEAEEAPGEPEFPKVDIGLVMENTGADRETALKALRDSRGNPAEAIIKLSE